jgi:hypothetical protein
MKIMFIFLVLFFGVQLLAAWAGATVMGVIGEFVCFAVIGLLFRAFWKA